MSTNSKFKILVIGDSKSGKTSLIRTFMNKPFKENLEPTDGLEVSILNFKRVDREYQIQLWDCGRFYLDNNDYMRKATFRNTSAVFITFDLTNPQSLKRIPIWLHQAQANECYLVYVFAMKKDLVPDPDLHELYQLLEEYKLMYFLYSATEHHQKKIIDLFAKIDNDKSFISRSSLTKGIRYSQASEGSMMEESQRNSIGNARGSMSGLHLHFQ